MFTESKIIMENGNFVWFHLLTLAGQDIALKGDVIAREKVQSLIKSVSDCKFVAIYRKDGGEVDIVLTFANWAMLDSVRNVCTLFGEDYRYCNVAFFAGGDETLQVRLTLFSNDDVPF